MQHLVVFKLRQFPTVSETFIVNAITATIDAGFDVRILVNRVNPPDNASQPQLIAQYKLMDKVDSLSDQPTDKKIRYKAFFKMLLNPLKTFFFLRLSVVLKKLTMDYVFWFQKLDALRKSQMFHVHFSTMEYPLLALKKIGYLKAPLMVTFHGYDAYALPSGIQLKSMLSDYKKFVKHITVNSNFLKQILINKGFKDSQINIVPMGVNSKLFDRDGRTDLPPQEPFKLITIGRLVPYKGQDYGIRIVKELIDKGMNVKYTIVGNGTQLEALKALIIKLELQDNVQLIGSVKQKEVIELLKEHHIFLMTSTVDNTGRREPFGLVAVECQALGLPIIGFDSGGFPETMKDNYTGFLVEDQNIKAAVDKVEAFIKDRQLLETFSKNAKKHVRENFELEKTNALYIKNY